MIFITVGSQKFPFDRLLEKTDALVADGTIREPVFAQTGSSAYRPQHYEWSAFLGHDEFMEKEKSADLVLTHGGTGSIVSALKLGCKVVAVPRRQKYGEHVNDHQIQIVRAFAEAGYLEPCYDLADLGSCLARAREKTYQPYRSNNSTFVGDLDSYLRSVAEERGKESF